MRRRLVIPENFRSIDIDKLMKTTRETYQTIPSWISFRPMDRQSGTIYWRRDEAHSRVAAGTGSRPREINGGGELVDVSKLENNA